MMSDKHVKPASDLSPKLVQTGLDRFLLDLQVFAIVNYSFGYKKEERVRLLVRFTMVF